MDIINNSIKIFLIEEDNFDEFLQNESVDEELIKDMNDSLLYNKKLNKESNKKIKKSLKEGFLENETLNFLLNNKLIERDEDISLFCNREFITEDFSMFHSDYIQNRMKNLIDIAHRHAMSKIVLKNPKLVHDDKKLTEVSDHTFKKITEHVLKHSDKFSSENHKEHAKKIHSHLTSDDFVSSILNEPKFADKEENKSEK